MPRVQSLKNARGLASRTGKLAHQRRAERKLRSADQSALGRRAFV